MEGSDGANPGHEKCWLAEPSMTVGLLHLMDLKFQISDFRSQISELRSQN